MPRNSDILCLRNISYGRRFSFTAFLLKRAKYSNDYLRLLCGNGMTLMYLPIDMQAPVIAGEEHHQPRRRLCRRALSDNRQVCWRSGRRHNESWVIVFQALGYIKPPIPTTCHAMAMGNRIGLVIADLDVSTTLEKAN